MKRILVIEDDPAILRGLVDSLSEEHFEVLSASDGEKGRLMAKRENISLVILDIMLPGKNGMDVCRELRREGVETPILMLTSKREEIDQVLGLELGADDYVTKPFSLKVLLARIRILLRRKTDSGRTIDEYSFGDVELDFRKQEARKKTRAVKLSTKEFKILKFLAAHEGEVITRDTLLTDVWEYGDGETIPTTRTIDNSILSIRKKLESDPSSPAHLLTIHGAGYKLLK